MIVRKEPLRHDDTFKIIMYKCDNDGSVSPNYQKAEFHDEVNTYYCQRVSEFERLHSELISGNISAVKFYADLQHLDARELAARMRTCIGAIKKHFTPEGFKGVTVKQLQNYAKIFNIAVSDFFQFLVIDKNLHACEKRLHSRLLQELTLSEKS